ncbi:methyl-accepting chemotaxis protein [Azoarcus olearius]|uniref:Methyl-accepting chemotaxis transducer n=1 Tax=Azoarcus sp. (strain BH72) TaxID=418699 RepID=A1K7T2_AZOSB|nr:methyl-accepting chemotaxis protein [Azoarcus olearius]ANQ85432.1 methyl-accepting chemotaxis transducer [Azoarcus olearius]CAL94887.1 methyl-accepting chemotaxis transducer [Azoarcus olearius]
MDVLFRPVIVLLDRLRYPYKFALIGFVSVAASVALLAQIYIGLSQDIEFTEREVAGLTLLDRGFAVLVTSQQHRGLSAGVLGGSDALRPKVAERAAALADAMAKLDAELAAPQWAPLRGSWEDIRGRLQRLASNGLSMSAPDNFREHTAVIERMLSWIGDVGDVSNLALDPEGDSYNLIDPMLHALPEMTERLGRLRGRTTGLIARGSAEREDQFAIVAQLAELAQTSAQLNDRLHRAGRENATLRDTLGAATVEIDTAVKRLRDAATSQVLEQRFSMQPSAFFDLGTETIDIVLRHQRDTVKPAAERLLADRLAGLHAAMVRDAVLSAIALLIAAYLFMGVYFSILRSVRELSRGAQQFAKGDYRTRVSFSAQDELREVADRFNAMAHDVAELIREIQHGAEQVGTSSAEVSTAAHRVAAGSDTQSEAASGMAAAVEEMTVGIDEISRHAGTAQTLAERSEKLSTDGGEVMKRTVDEMERIAAAVNASAATIGELGHKAHHISAMVDAIREIADQTNLLALNAAIEAARAGESGRGFAVVADEVRKLAERTARATEEITEMVGSIQQGTEKAVASMEAGVSRVRDGATLTTQAGQSMGEIRDGAREVLQAVSDISLALREQSSASADIARNVERIAQMAEENSSAVRDTAEIASTLQSLAGELERKVERFKV